MTTALDSLDQIAGQFDAIVLDQWGVLHDGTTPFPGAVACIDALHQRGTRLAVLSNSGKRAAPNAQRIAGKGFAPDHFAQVMTSGEALWRDVAAGRTPGTRVFAITAHPEDAQTWASGLDLTFVESPDLADWVLIMGLSEFGGDQARAREAIDAIRAVIIAAGRPVYCSNPDRTSPRAGGALVLSPGTLAHEVQDAGLDVHFYGKPHLPIFRAMEEALNIAPNRLLMVGDSLEHDIAGGQAAGWSTAFVEGGIHAAAFASGDRRTTIRKLVEHTGGPAPDFTLPTLR